MATCGYVRSAAVHIVVGSEPPPQITTLPHGYTMVLVTLCNDSMALFSNLVRHRVVLWVAVQKLVELAKNGGDAADT